MESFEGLEPRLTALEARAQATEIGLSTANEKLNGVIGGQDVMLGMLIGQGQMLESQGQMLESQGQMLESQGQMLESQRQKLEDHGQKLAEHDLRFDRVDAKLDLVVTWIQSQP
jgi:uncharacterized coiled-coil protein SlyX